MKEKIQKITNYCIGVMDLYRDCHIQAYAGEAAFFVMFSAVPLIMIGIIIFGNFFPLDIAIVNNFLSDMFVGQAREVALRIFEEIRGKSTIPLASISTIFLIWAAAKGIRCIGSGIAVIYTSDKDYNIVKFAFNSIIYTILLVIVSIFSILILGFAAPIETFLENMFDERADFLLGLFSMRNIISFVTFTIMFMVAYKFLAHSKLSLFNHLPGAAIASSGWIIYSFVFSIYIKYFSKYSSVYGSLGAVMLFMLWIYMCMNILLCGALFNRIRANGYKIDIKK